MGLSKSMMPRSISRMASMPMITLEIEAMRIFVLGRHFLHVFGGQPEAVGVRDLPTLDDRHLYADGSILGCGSINRGLKPIVIVAAGADNWRQNILFRYLNSQRFVFHSRR